MRCSSATWLEAFFERCSPHNAGAKGSVATGSIKGALQSGGKPGKGFGCRCQRDAGRLEWMVRPAAESGERTAGISSLVITALRCRSRSGQRSAPSGGSQRQQQGARFGCDRGSRRNRAPCRALDANDGDRRGAGALCTSRPSPPEDRRRSPPQVRGQRSRITGPSPSGQGGGHLRVSVAPTLGKSRQMRPPGGDAAAWNGPAENTISVLQ